ncbi:hypothetical protein cco93_07552 [Campylobacter coli H8]|nr:hypothetical protein cco71_03302 [Campylobacter coli 317/04]EIB09776.1 hypothetical protein cco93_07552 [Campylobacter coli H8]
MLGDIAKSPNDKCDYANGKDGKCDKIIFLHKVKPFLTLIIPL